jgi:hypothetical protein
MVARRSAVRDDAVVGESDRPVSCLWCGTAAEELPLTWTVQTVPVGEPGRRGQPARVSYLCETCTRDNARQIESSLPTEYW